MQIDEYIKNHQPIIFKTISNALSRQTLSHAYLIVGEIGTPLLETATYLGKSILCDCLSPLACLKCNTCKRISSNNYPDFLIFDGSNSTIKKEQISSLESEFEKTAFEEKGKKVYIIHLVENMTIQAINAILKFLEEPKDEVYAFLTTNNVTSVLPTIVSRCQMLKMRLLKREDVLSQSKSLDIPLLDVQLLSYFNNDIELIKKNYENQDYIIAKDTLLEILDNFKTDYNNALYISQKLSTGKKFKKESARFFIDMLIQVFEDMVSLKYNKSIYLKEISGLLQDLSTSLPHIEESLQILLKVRNEINLNVNIPLCIDHTIIELTKEKIYERK